MWEEIGDGVRPAKHRCKCYCFYLYSYYYSYSTFDVTRNRTHTPRSELLVIVLHDRRRHPTDADTMIKYLYDTFRWSVIFNTHTILLTKSISSIENWKSNNTKKSDMRTRKTVTMMGWRDCRVVSCRKPWKYIHFDGYPTVFNIHTILLATVHTQVGLVWFSLIWFASIRFGSVRSVWL